MQNERENWVDETLNVLAGMEKSIPSDEFYVNVLKRIKAGNEPARVKTSWLFTAAACFLVLTTFNLLGLSKNLNSSNLQPTSEIDQFANAYGLQSNFYNY